MSEYPNGTETQSNSRRAEPQAPGLRRGRLTKSKATWFRALPLADCLEAEAGVMGPSAEEAEEVTAAGRLRLLLTKLPFREAQEHRYSLLRGTKPKPPASSGSAAG